MSTILIWKDLSSSHRCLICDGVTLIANFSRWRLCMVTSFPCTSAWDECQFVWFNFSINDKAPFTAPLSDEWTKCASGRRGSESKTGERIKGNGRGRKKVQSSNDKRTQTLHREFKKTRSKQGRGKMKPSLYLCYCWGAETGAAEGLNKLLKLSRHTKAHGECREKLLIKSTLQ